MPRRLFALLVGLSIMAAGCGGTASGGSALPEEEPASPASAHPVDPATAQQAFDLLTQLDQAWKKQDCATVGELTAGAEHALGGRACEATRNGRPAPTGDPELLLPSEGGWFAALADKAYYVFAQDGGRWRLAAGPIPLVGAAPPTEGTASPAPAAAVRARLVPQRHLTFLTDPAGVAGVTFPANDPVAKLMRELTTRKAKADVELLGDPVHALAMADGSMLVFHALRITSTQKSSLYPKAVLKSFGVQDGTTTVTVTELVILATKVSAGNKLQTVGLRRALADIVGGIR
ncbi:hypothetical protein ACIBG8_23385 [Nonomuraea sp. NPDC050556]|uniref:hypothetical protein n=1 Tax=Nonomuraea sp. NPDC050556 TaxID=3364369 RepID=UPI003793C18B